MTNGALFAHPAELADLWDGPQGAEQRAVRLLCLAAAGGDLEELQVCVDRPRGR